MKNHRVLSMLSLAAKAGRIKSGEFSTEKHVRQGTAALVIVAGDASDNTKKKFNNMCSFYGVTIRFFSDKSSLGHSIGKELRASIVVTDMDMAGHILKKIDE